MDEDAFESLKETLGIHDMEGKEIILVCDTNCDFEDNTMIIKNINIVCSEYEIELIMKTNSRSPVAAIQA